MRNYVETADYINIVGVNDSKTDIKSVWFEQDCIKSVTGLPIGTAEPRKLMFECASVTPLEGKYIVYHAKTINAAGNGIDTTVGTFMVKKAPCTDGIHKVIAKDLLCKADSPYKTELNYAAGNVTINDMLAEICTSCGLTLQPGIVLVNGAHVYTACPFVAGETYREAIAYIAEVNGAFAHMIYDDDYGDLLAITVLDIAANAVTEVFQDEYSSLPTQAQTKAINTVKIRYSLNDTSTTSGDSTGGILYIDDNPLAFEAAAQTALIAGILSKVNGLTYLPYIAKGAADPALNCGDRIRVFDTDGVEHETFMFAQVYVSTQPEKERNGWMSAETKAQTVVETVQAKSAGEKLAKQLYVQNKAYVEAVTAITEILSTPGGSFEKKFKHVNGVLIECTPTDKVEETWWTSKEVIDGTTRVVRINSAGLGVSVDGGVTFKNAITGDGILGSMITYDIAKGGKSIIGVENGQRFEIYGAVDGWPYIDGYDDNNVLRSRWSPNTGFQFTDSTGQFITSIATTTEDKTITVGSGKHFATIQAAIDSIPMIGCHDALILADSGVYHENLVIRNHFGGKITIQPNPATSGLESVIEVDRFDILNCTTRIEMLDFKKSGTTSNIKSCSYVKLRGDVDFDIERGLYVDTSTVEYSGYLEGNENGGIVAKDSTIIFNDAYGGLVLVNNCIVKVVQESEHGSLLIVEEAGRNIILKSNGEAIINGKQMAQQHEFLTLTKSGNQPVGTTAATVVTFDQSLTDGGTSLLVKEGNAIKALVACRILLTAFAAGTDLNYPLFVRYSLRKNGSTFISRSPDHRGGNDGTTSWGGALSAPLMELAVNDHIELVTDSDDSSYTITGAYTYLQGEAWAV